MIRRILCLLGAVGCLVLAQTYKCDWSVAGIGGGEMAGSYRCGSTVGQTAAGPVTGPNYWALVGFWQPELPTGISEAAQWPGGRVGETRLYAPQPNPARTRVAIRYSLCADTRVRLSVHDLTGRVVRTLCASNVRRGAYSIKWDGRDQTGRSLANGIYFVRLVAGSYRSTEKVVLQR